MELKEKIERRQEYNLKVLDMIKELILKYPDMRFTQVLWAAGIFRREVGEKDIEDTFYEESVDTFKKLEETLTRL